MTKRKKKGLPKRRNAFVGAMFKRHPRTGRMVSPNQRRCMHGLQCQCGKAAWEGDDDHLRCTECHTGPRVEGNMKAATHCARKAHGTHIRPGDKYIRTVTFGYFPDGARTLSIQKQRIEKGPLWAVAEIIES